MPQTLRPYQAEALFQLRSTLAQQIRRIVLMMTTGAGKTQVASEIMQGAVAKGNRAFFIVDSLELVEQAQERFVADGMHVGVIQGQHLDTDYSAPVQVATIQTLKRRWTEMPDSLKPAVIVIDECHVLHQAHIDIIEECKARKIPVIGLSATPFRQGLGQYFETLVVGATTPELTEQGYLAPAICYAPHVPDLKGVKTGKNGDWCEDALAEYMGDAKLVGDVIEQWFKLGENRQTLFFGANVAHSKAVCAAFQAAGVKAMHIDGYEKDADYRKQIIDDFRSGKITVLCNVGILTKGFDAPETSCLILGRPTKSLMLHYQILGRGLRIAEGKTNCIIIDHAGNCLRNGVPSDPLPTTLDDGKAGHRLDRKQREKTEPVDKPCAHCGHISTRHVCPACGFKPEVRRDVEVRDGELYEITTGTRKEWTPDNVTSLYAELLGYCQLKGYQPGWAYHKCREYAGRAPRNTRQIVARHPSDHTMGIIKHLTIRNAKRRASA